MVGLGGVLAVECGERGGSRSSPPALERAGELGFPPRAPAPGTGWGLCPAELQSPPMAAHRPGLGLKQR